MAPRHTPVYANPYPESHAGAASAFLAFFLWGLMPLYWKLLSPVSPLEVIAHRGIWSFVCLLPLVVLTGRWPEVRAVAATGRTLRVLLGTTALLTINWLLFIWAVQNGHVLETALGNFITPLLNVAAGVVFFRDRMRPAQAVALALAAAGVIFRVVSVGYLPWIALVSSVSFCLYGVLRKVASVEAIPGLFVENTLFLPLAASLLVYLNLEGGILFGTRGNTELSLLLVGAGLATSIPMALFAYGARHLKLTTLGLFHYLVPTLSFAIGIFVFKESFGVSYFITFALIWVGIALYTIDGLSHLRK